MMYIAKLTINLYIMVYCVKTIDLHNTIFCMCCCNYGSLLLYWDKKKAFMTAPRQQILIEGAITSFADSVTPAQFALVHRLSLNILYFIITFKR